jgi:hypothetical protein
MLKADMVGVDRAYKATVVNIPTILAASARSRVTQKLSQVHSVEKSTRTATSANICSGCTDSLNIPFHTGTAMRLLGNHYDELRVRELHQLAINIQFDNLFKYLGT